MPLGWVGSEAIAKRRLLSDLRPFLALARLAHSFAERALQLRAGSPLDQASEVQARLLVQVSNQLRLVELAAERGYALQALGSAATLYELVSALAYIDSDKARAGEWFAHSNWEWPYPSPKKRPAGIRQMLTATGVPPSDVQQLLTSWEDHHTRFCAAKHANPLLLKKYGISRDPKQLVLHIGAIVGPAYTLLSRIALYHGSRLLADGSVFFALRSLDKRGPAVSAFKRARKRILQRFDALAAIQTLRRAVDG